MHKDESYIIELLSKGYECYQNGDMEQAEKFYSKSVNLFLSFDEANRIEYEIEILEATVNLIVLSKSISKKIEMLQLTVNVLEHLSQDYFEQYGYSLVSYLVELGKITTDKKQKKECYKKALKYSEKGNFEDKKKEILELIKEKKNND